jgi:hypothetical protein
MSASNQPVIDFSKLQTQVNKYFEKQLDDLGLSMSALRRQSEESLRRNLIVVKQAIENHESFGKFAIRMSVEGAIIVSAKRESHFEVGILPLLLERYQLILKRLDEFDKKKKISLEEIQNRNANIRVELTKIARGEINQRLWAFILALVVVWAILFYLIQRFGWSVLDPWIYLLEFGLAIGSYGYFAIKQREFSPLTIYQHALDTRKKQLFQLFGIQDE